MRNSKKPGEAKRIVKKVAAIRDRQAGTAMGSFRSDFVSPTFKQEGQQREYDEFRQVLGHSADLNLMVRHIQDTPRRNALRRALDVERDHRIDHFLKGYTREVDVNDSPGDIE